MVDSELKNDLNKDIKIHKDGKGHFFIIQLVMVGVVVKRANNFISKIADVSEDFKHDYLEQLENYCILIIYKKELKEVSFQITLEI